MFQLPAFPANLPRPGTSLRNMMKPRKLKEKVGKARKFIRSRVRSPRNPRKAKKSEGEQGKS